MTDKTDTNAWRAAFDDRHEFDVYPEHFMSGLRNEFCAGWHAALKSQNASEPKALTDDQIRRIWLIETGTTEQDSPLAILDFARAIIAATEAE